MARRRYPQTDNDTIAALVSGWRSHMYVSGRGNEIAPGLVHNRQHFIQDGQPILISYLYTERTGEFDMRLFSTDDDYMLGSEQERTYSVGISGKLPSGNFANFIAKGGHMQDVELEWRHPRKHCGPMPLFAYLGNVLDRAKSATQAQRLIDCAYNVLDDEVFYLQKATNTLKTAHAMHAVQEQLKQRETNIRR